MVDAISYGHAVNTNVQLCKLENESNWSGWKNLIETYLRQIPNAAKLLSGEYTAPPPLLGTDSTDESKQREYDTKSNNFTVLDSKVKLILLLNLSDQLQCRVRCCESAKDVWNELITMFEGGSTERAYNKLDTFFDFQINDGESIRDGLARLRNIWTEVTTIFKLDNRLLIARALRALPFSFNAFRTTWLNIPEDQQSIERLIEKITAWEISTSRSDAPQAAYTIKNRPHPQRELSSVKQPFTKSANRYKPSQSKNSRVYCKYHKSNGHSSENCHVLKARQEARTVDSAGSVLGVGFIGVALPVHHQQNAWICDSGASCHMAKEQSLFREYKSVSTGSDFVRQADGSNLKTSGVGSISCSRGINKINSLVTLNNVRHVPNLDRNLFSMTSALDYNDGSTFIASGLNARFVDANGQVLATASRPHKGALFTMDFTPIQSINNEAYTAAEAASDKLQYYHELLGHQDKVHVREFIRRELQISLPIDRTTCNACAISKSHRLSFASQRKARATTPGEIINVDVCGPFATKALSGARYYLCFKDDFSRFRVIYTIKSKAEVADKTQDYINRAITAGHIIKHLRSDNGTEFTNKEIQKILSRHGINHLTTPPYTPQQNGAAERENRTIVECVRTLLQASGGVLPKFLWAELACTAAYLLNRTGKSSLPDKSPYELWFAKKPRLTHLRPIASSVYVHIPAVARNKLDPKASHGYLLGYHFDDGFKVYIPEKGSFVISHDVKFSKNQPEFSTSEHGPPMQLQTTPQDFTTISNSSTKDLNTTEELDNQHDSISLVPVPRGNNYNLRPNPTPTNHFQAANFIDTEICYALCTEGLSTVYKSEPTSYHEAVNSSDADQWKNAMSDEINSLIQSHTWDLVTLPSEKRTIDNRWVFKQKLNPDGSICRYKARLVVKGYKQRSGIDFDETFSPVAKLSTIRTVLAAAAVNKLFLKQFDVSSAFLHGNLHEEIYMKQPEGFNDNTGRVCKLKKSLYGLRQAPRCWNERFCNFMTAQGFNRSNEDSCLFLKHSGERHILLVLYVDDGLIAATQQSDIDDLLNTIQAEFQITTSDATFYLGMEIQRKSDGSIFINQAGYTQRLLERFGMAFAKATQTPLEVQRRPLPEDATDDSNFPFRSVVGSLMYLMCCTRPDIAFAISRLSRKLDNPNSGDIVRAKRVLRYIAGTRTRGICYQTRGPKRLNVFSDSDFAGCSETGKSTSGVVALFAGGAVSWMSQLQSTVALSTMIAEIIAASEAAQEAVWLQRLVVNITNTTVQLPILHVDNAAAVAVARNPEYHRRTKYLAARHFLVRDAVSSGSIEIAEIRTDKMVADGLTKALPSVKHIAMVRDLGLTEELGGILK